MPLSDLAAALAAATGPSRALEERMAVEVFGLNAGRRYVRDRSIPHGGYYVEAPRYTASLDAITGAIRERWEFIDIMTRETHKRGRAVPANVSIARTDSIHYADACDVPTVALALCLAAVRLAMAEEGK